MQIELRHVRKGFEEKRCRRGFRLYHAQVDFKRKLVDCVKGDTDVRHSGFK
jgi:hypothetical protein